MGAASSSAGAEPLNVSRCPPMSKFLYLSPGAQRLIECDHGAPPARASADEGTRVVRVVCISDTHNEHHGLRLPAGDLLIHAGDCLTETGQRGYVTRSGGVIQEVKPQGVELFKYFADWFGALDFPHKAVIAGNHDLVLEGLGKARVQQMLDQSCTRGRCVYLEHEEVCLGGVRIFGSPFAYWGGKNDAFFARSCDYTDMPDGVHVMVTHVPAILPGEGGGCNEDSRMTDALHRTGAQLHVSGHCHWAHGLYQARRTRHGAAVPCVVASVCSGRMYGGPWPQPERLASSDGVRGDPLDRKFGGYNLDQPPIVCDLRLPAAEVEDRAPCATAATPSMRSESTPEVDSVGKPALLLFGPPNDPDFVRLVLPRVSALFDVEFVDATCDGLQAVADRSYVACVAKLGTEGNLSYPIIQELRKAQGAEVFVAIHSFTAAANPHMRERLTAELAVNLFVAPGDEEQLFQALEALPASR